LQSKMKFDSGNWSRPESNLVPCFITGIKHRSGTNFLFRLLSLHPECVAPGPIWEDFMLHHSNLLLEYTHCIYGSWKRDWKVSERLAPPEMFLNYIGDALIRFLNLQVTSRSIDSSVTDIGPHCGDKSRSKYLITKTPSVEGLHNFFKLFPHAYLIIIIRDGRAVVESGVRSFDWDYEQATQEWSDAAHTIIQFGQDSRNTDRKFLIVKYEELYSRTEEEMRKILKFMGLDLAAYDFNSAKSLSVIGSSELRKQKEDKVHWNPVEKDSHFNPLLRWSHWNKAKHDRFNWIGGDYLTQFGYTREMQDENKSIYYIASNMVLDLRWSVRILARWIKAKIGQTRARYLSISGQNESVLR